MFSAPLWLYALATLAIPLALHLWSRRPRQVIRVGSLRHITDLTEARSWSARLTEPLLLILRLGILASLVVALAGPRLSSGKLSGASSHLVLIEPALLEDTALIRSDPLLDSLTRSRATVRLLESGLPRFQLDGMANDAVRGTRNEERGTLWELLASADRLVSKNGEMLIIARPKVAMLGGRRPALRARVSWHVPRTNPKSAWAAARWRTPGDSLLVLTGTGDASGVRYQSAMSSSRESGEGCNGCAEVKPVTVWAEGPDSNSSRRLQLAAVAVGGLLGQPVETAQSPDQAELTLTTAQLSDSMLQSGRNIVSIPASVVGSLALADTVMAHWPWQPLARDPADPRQLSLAQALPVSGTQTSPDQRDARVPLLLLALILFTVERWLSTRPSTRSA